MTAGCNHQDQISHYQVPHPKPPHRVLGAIVPHGDRGWFFKLSGSNDLVAAQAAAFTKFIQSIHFDAGEEANPQWQLPEGWKQTRGGDMRFATIEIPADGKPLELSVIGLPSQGKPEALLPNLNRWRGQIGLAPISAEQLATKTNRFEVAGATATLVNWAGKVGQTAPMAAPFASGAPSVAPPDGDSDNSHTLTYDAPATWKSGELTVSRGGISLRRAAAFTIGEGSHQAEITVTSLPAATGATLPNVNRWRRQIGLKPLSQAELDDETTTIKINGDEQAAYFRLVGPEQAVLGVISMHGGMAWFTKLQGPHDVAVEHEAEFKRFVESIRY